MRHPTRLLRLLAVLVALLAFIQPPPAHARPPAMPSRQGGPTLTVDKLGAASTPPGSETCDGAPNNCSLRKAIQLANTTSDTTILFDKP